jgi:hypothetical protein
MILDEVHLLFRIRIHNLKLRIRILQKVSDPYGSGSTTLFYRVVGQALPSLEHLALLVCGLFKI